MREFSTGSVTILYMEDLLLMDLILQEVSREFRSTLEREIGLDEDTSTSNSAYRPSSIFSENQHTTFDSSKQMLYSSFNDRWLITWQALQFILHFHHFKLSVLNVFIRSKNGSKFALFYSLLGASSLT